MSSISDPKLENPKHKKILDFVKKISKFARLEDFF